MNELMTLQGYEVQLRMYREQVMGGWLGMGRTLIAAKEANVVPHGQWETWVENNAGMSVRDAQRLMQLAREIGEDSPLAKLDMTKARMLMRLPAEERETFATENKVESVTSRELAAAINAKLRAEKLMEGKDLELDRLRHMVADQTKSQQAMMDKANDLQQRYDAMSARAETLDRQLDQLINNPETVEVVPEDYEALKQRDQSAAARIREAEDFADQQEERVRELERKLQEAESQGAGASAMREFVDAAGTLLSVMTRISCDITQLERSDIGAMLSWLGSLQTQIGTLRNAIRTAPVSGGVGYVR